MGVGAGSKKSGGRKKGIPNRRTLRLEEICKKKKIEPFVALLELCKSNDLMIRLAALKEVCQYLYPKRKAIEISESRENPIGASSEKAEIEKLREQIRLNRNERGWK